MKLNEITLSNDLKTIEFEINQHRMFASNSIIEIGKRLNHVKEKDLAHGQFMDWVENTLDMSYTTANRYMKVAKEFPNLMSTQNLSLENLFLITTLPEREKGEEIKKLEEGEGSTTREIRDLKKQLKQKNELIENMADSMHDFELQARELEGEVQRLKNKPAEVIEREVLPADYHQVKQENERLKQTNDKLTRDLKWVQDDLKMKQTQYNLLESSSAKAKELERKIQSLQSQEKSILDKMQAVDDFHKLEKEFNDFFDSKMAPMRFKGIANHLYATNAVDRIRKMITQAELWAEEMSKILPNKNMKIIEGEIIDD